MPYSEPDELIRVRKLIFEGKFEEGNQILDKFSEKIDFSFQERISFYLLKSLVAGMNFDQALSTKYAHLAYKEINRFENSLQLLDVNIRMAIVSIWQNKPGEAEKFITKFENLIETFPEELSSEILMRKAHLAAIKGNVYLQRGEVEKALKFAKDGLILREELDIKAQVGQSLNQIAYYYWIVGELNLALEYAKSSKNIAQKLSYLSLIQRANFVFGNIYSGKGEFDLAIDYYEQALDFAQKERDQIFMEVLLNKLGLSYQVRGEFKLALESMEKGLDLSKKNGSEIQIGLTCDSLFH
ncbi:MAG: tetratricopeptide repeat protein, partial [Promethearchaeota archaeon]